MQKPVDGQVASVGSCQFSVTFFRTYYAPRLWLVRGDLQLPQFDVVVKHLHQIQLLRLQGAKEKLAVIVGDKAAQGLWRRPSRDAGAKPMAPWSRPPGGPQT